MLVQKLDLLTIGMFYEGMKQILDNLVGYVFIVLMILFFAFYIISALGVTNVNGSWLKGKVTAQYEGELAKHMPHYNESVSLWNGFKYVFFKEGRSGVLIEDNNWLFTIEEFSYPDNYKKNIKNNKNYILSVEQSLESQNIKLIVVPVPSKASFYNNKLRRYRIPSYRESLYSGFINFLNDNGLSYINLYDAFQKTNEDVFLRTDTHWNAYGAQVTAEQVAQLIKRKNIKLSSKNFVSVKYDRKEHEGDLVSFSSRFFIKSEEIGIWKTINQSEDDLFEDQSFEAVLIGTSYSENSLWNFEGFLKEYLKSDVLNLADEGKGPFEVMGSYLGSSYLKEDKPKVIIWEIPERYLPIASDHKGFST